MCPRRIANPAICPTVSVKLDEPFGSILYLMIYFISTIGAMRSDTHTQKEVL